MIMFGLPRREMLREKQVENRWTRINIIMKIAGQAAILNFNVIRCTQYFNIACSSASGSPSQNHTSPNELYLVTISISCHSNLKLMVAHKLSKNLLLSVKPTKHSFQISHGANLVLHC